MKPLIALVRREYLEHKTAFLIVPGVILATSLLLLIIGFATNDFNMPFPRQVPAGIHIFDAAYASIFGLWTAYLLIALVFYISDAFGADRRNNALLFWKSMPQSDLTVLSSKMLTGATVFPALIAIWAMITGIVAYLTATAFAVRFGVVLLPGLVETLTSWVQITIAGIGYVALNLLWYAPFFGWLALLGTIFGRWSIPLSFLVPALLVLVESVVTLGGLGGKQWLLGFLEWRFQGLLDDEIVIKQLFVGETSAFDIIGHTLAGMDIVALIGGLAFTVLMVWLASEYRRRRLVA